MKEVKYVITDPVGFHARPAGQIATNGKFQIPLYEIKNGAIKTDFRSCMSLPIRIY